MKLKLKPPASRNKRLKLKYYKSLFDFASNLLSDSTCGATPWTLHFTDAETEREYFSLQWWARRQVLRVGAYTRPLQSSS
jgi:hypothetical protein